MPTMNTVQFHNADRTFNIKNRKKLKSFIPVIFTDSNTSLDSINYIFCSDTFLLDINREFLKHTYYTDIITFDLTAGKAPTIGEIYISIDRVKDNATIHGRSYIEEIHRVVFHGALHLCGYKDKKQVDIAAMRRAEDFYLKNYFS